MIDMDLGPGAYLAICAVLLIVLTIAHQVRLRKQNRTPRHVDGIGSALRENLRSLYHDSSTEWGEPPEGGAVNDHSQDTPQATSGGSDAA